MFLIIQLYLICRKDGMQSPTREEMVNLQMYDTAADVQEKNDAVTDAQKKNDASCKCTIKLWMYKKIMSNMFLKRNKWQMC